MNKCPSKSPTRANCILEDSELDHFLGHEAFNTKGAVINWPVVREDRDRWDRQERLAAEKERAWDRANR